MEISINPIIFSFGAFTPRWYGLMFVVGFIGSYFYIRKNLKRFQLSENDASRLFHFSFVGMLVGARLGHVVFYNPKYYLSHPEKIFAVWEGGLASHGGGIGLFIALYLFSRKYQQLNFLKTADLLSAPAMWTGGLIRIGNFINGEILGKPTDLPWAVSFVRIDNIMRHPVQIYESISYFLIFIFIYKIYPKKYQREGYILGLTLLLSYGTRFFWEFYKEPQELYQHPLVLNTGAWLSLPYILSALWLIRSNKLGKSL